jgi:chemotaxis protein CheD
LEGHGSSPTAVGRSPGQVPTARPDRIQPSLDGPRILPGEFRISSEGLQIQTLVGSCIAACIRDPVHGCGGMNHFLLPDGLQQSKADAGRYGLFAMELLINGLLGLGADRRRLEAKIAGGGRIHPRGRDIGQTNIDFVRSFLQREGIRLLSEDVGGTTARRVVYATRTGQMWVRRLDPESTREVRTLETARSRQTSGPSEPSVELF